MRKNLITLGLLSVTVLFSSCMNIRMGGDKVPPVDSSEGIVEAGEAAAQLWVEPEILGPGEKAVIRVVNHGSTGLVFGRPIQVERWNGNRWNETEESRSTMWTMDLLQVAEGESGLEQLWPFSDRVPDPGWYRFSKSVQPSAGDSEPIVIRARIRVAD